MKKNRLYILLSILSSVLLTNCKQQKDIKDQMDQKTTICYTAIDQTDTAWLKIDTAGHEILGVLDFNYANKKHYKGQIKASLKGDTLKGHYDFKVNNIDKWYRNPVAFLKKDTTLIMGVGDVTMIWGSPFFDQKTPIDYNKGRFVFKQTGCVIKSP